MTQLFTNNASTVSITALGMADTEVTVNAGDGLLFSAPTATEYQLLTIHDAAYSVWEVVSLEARAGDVLTISRGIEGVQQVWPSGSYVSSNVTAKTLTDIVGTLGTTTATADEALALAQSLEGSIGSGGGSAGSSTIIGYYEYQTYVKYAAGTEYKYEICYLDTHITLVDYGSVVQTLGYSAEDFKSVQVTRNGVPQTQLIDDEYRTYIKNSTTQGNNYRIIGTRHLQFEVPLIYGDTITIMSPRPYWIKEGEQTTYADLYAATNVQKSYIAGGIYTGATTGSTSVRRLTWATLLTSVYTGKLPIYTKNGSGGISDTVGFCYFIGGFGSYAQSTLVTLNVASVSVSVSYPFSGGTYYGSTFTDTVFGWICGYGPNFADTAIAKFDIVASTVSVLGVSLGGTNVSYVSTACDKTTGYIYNDRDETGNATGTAYLEKVACATDTISGFIATGIAGANVSSLVMFRENGFYIWGNNMSTVGVYAWDRATDSVASVWRDGYYGPYYSTSHGVVCDGENQAQSMYSCLLSSPTAAIVMNTTMLLDTSRNHLYAVDRPVGAATDYWSNS